MKSEFLKTRFLKWKKNKKWKLIESSWKERKYREQAEARGKEIYNGN